MRLITNDLVEIARRRVLRGAHWLDENAPLDWERHMFAILPGGKAWFRAHDSYGNQCVLALAFERMPEKIPSLVGYDGYVHYANVMKHFNLSDQQAVAFGFNSTLSGYNQDMVIATDLAWEEALTTYRAPRHQPLQWEPVPTPFEEKILSLTIKIRSLISDKAA